MWTLIVAYTDKPWKRVVGSYEYLAALRDHYENDRYPKRFVSLLKTRNAKVDA